MFSFRHVLLFAAVVSVDVALAVKGGLVPAGAAPIGTPQNYADPSSSWSWSSVTSAKLYGAASNYNQHYSEPPAYLQKLLEDYPMGEESNDVPRRMLKKKGRGGSGGSGGSGGDDGGDGVKSFWFGYAAGGGRTRSSAADDLEENLTGPTYAKAVCTTPQCTATAIPVSAKDASTLAAPDFLPAKMRNVWDAAQRGKNVKGQDQWKEFTSNKDLSIGESIGGPHGEYFDDTMERKVDYRNLKIKSVTLIGDKAWSKLLGIKFNDGEVRLAGDDEAMLAGAGDSKDLKKRQKNLKELRRKLDKGEYQQKTMKLDEDEYLNTSVMAACRKGPLGQKHTRVCAAAFTTNKNKSVEVALKKNENNRCVVSIAPKDQEIIGLAGREGDVVDLAAVITRKRGLARVDVTSDDADWTHKDPFGVIHADASFSKAPLDADHGELFNNLNLLPVDYRIAKVKQVIMYGLRREKRADNGAIIPGNEGILTGIQFVYHGQDATNSDSILNGPKFADSEVLTLEKDEFLVEAQGTACKSKSIGRAGICNVEFATSKGQRKSFAKFTQGINVKTLTKYTARKGEEIIALFGRQDRTMLYDFGVIAVPQAPAPAPAQPPK